MSSPDPTLMALRPRVPHGFALRVEAAIARDGARQRRRRTFAGVTAVVALAAMFAAVLRAAAPTPASVEDLAWTQRTLEGTAVVRVPWVTVTGLDPFTRAELVLIRTERTERPEPVSTPARAPETPNATELDDRASRPDPEPEPEIFQETPMLAKSVLAIVATAGAVLTVHVVRGRAAVKADGDRPAVVLSAGDHAAVPVAGATTITRGTQVAAIARTAPVPPHHVLASEPDTATVHGDGECPEAGPDGECPQGGKGECAHAEAPGPSERVELDVANAPSMGPANAKVTIVEITDFQCPFCEKAVATVHDLAALYPDDIRVVIKHLPLPGHKLARGAAIAAMAAHRQGKFWEMHEMLFSNQERLDRDSMIGFAKHLGLDTARFERDLADPAIAAQVDADANEAMDKGFQGVPSFTINGRTVIGAVPLEQMRAIVDEELARLRQGH